MSIILISKNFLFASPHTYNLHQELLNFMLVAMSTQLLSVPSLGPKDVHPFIDAAMTEVTIWNLDFLFIISRFPNLLKFLKFNLNFQESSLVCSVVRRLLLNYITRPRISVNSSSYSIFSEENQPGVLQRVGSAAGMGLFYSLFSTLKLFSFGVLLMMYCRFFFCIW